MEISNIIEMNRIFILIILVISLISCKEKNKKPTENLSKNDIQAISRKNDSISNFHILSKIDKEIKEDETTINTYKSLDSITKHIDGADAEYYVEIYKNAILLDTKKFNSYFTKINKSIDNDVINFFNEDKSILKQICLKANISLLKDFDTAIIYDKDGYSNLREGQSIKSNIIETIKSDKKIIILNKKKDWRLVFTGSNVGYIHKSRIKLNQ